MAPKFFSTKRDSRKGEDSRNYLQEKLGSGGLNGLTADGFLQIWAHYDTNQNMVLDGRELDKFLEDFLNSTLTKEKTRASLSHDEVEALKTRILRDFDKNLDGSISVQELSNILSPQEQFFLLFRLDKNADKGVDYTKIWKKYDKDMSGYIEKSELKVFMRDLIYRATKQNVVDEKRLDAHVTTMMELFDVNGDGKLGFSELVRMLPPSENFVEKLVDKVFKVEQLTLDDLKALLNSYDKDATGTLEGSELSNLAKDILEITHRGQAYDLKDVEYLKDTLLLGCDVDHDGRLDLGELQLVIGAVIQEATEGVARKQGTNHHVANGKTQTDYHKQYMDAYRSQNILSHVKLDNNH